MVSKYISWLTQAFFIVSMISGVIIIFAYNPNYAYDSLQEINYIIPFGSFFRKLHYFSSECFFVILIIHIIVELYKKEIFIKIDSWNYSIIAFFCVVFLMFTGFVLKGDQSSNAAAQVAITLIKETTILENILPLIYDQNSFYWKFFIWHILFLPIILIYAVYMHVKRIKVNYYYLVIALAITLLISLFLKIPFDIPLEIEVEQILGPWFFWGAENLLSLGLPSYLVNLILFIPFGLLFVMIYFKKNFIYKILLIIWVIAYAYFSI